MTLPPQPPQSTQNGSKELLEELRFWQGVDERALLELNKTIATFSTAILAASIAFVKDIYSPQGVWDTVLLIVSWIPFFLSIGFVLASYRWHRATTIERVEYLTVDQRGDDTAEIVLNIRIFSSKAEKWSRRSRISLVIGLILIAGFVSVELFQEQLCQPQKTSTMELQLEEGSACSGQRSSLHCPGMSQDSVKQLPPDSL